MKHKTGKETNESFQTPYRVKLEDLIVFSFPYVSDSSVPVGVFYSDEMSALDTSLAINLDSKY